MSTTRMLRDFGKLVTQQSPDEMFFGWTSNQLKSLFADELEDSPLVPFLKLSKREDYSAMVDDSMIKYVHENTTNMYSFIMTYAEVIAHTEKCTPFNVMGVAMMEKVQMVFAAEDKVRSASEIRKLMVGVKEKKTISYQTEIVDDLFFDTVPVRNITYIKDDVKSSSEVRRGCIVSPPDFNISTFSPYEFQTMNCNASILAAAVSKISNKQIVPAVVKDNLNKFYGNSFFKTDLVAVTSVLVNPYHSAIKNTKIENLTGSKLASFYYDANTALSLPLSSVIMNYMQKQLFALDADSPGMVSLQFVDKIEGKERPSKWYDEQEANERAYRKFSPAVNPLLPIWRSAEGTIFVNLAQKKIDSDISNAYKALDIARVARLEGDKGFSDLTQGYVYGIYGMPRVLANAGYLSTMLHFFEYSKYKRVLFYSDSKDSTHCIAEVVRETSPEIELVSFGPASTCDHTSRVVVWGKRSINHIADIATDGDLIIHMGYENHRLGAIPSQEEEVARNIENTYQEYDLMGKSKADVLIIGYVYKQSLPKGYRVMVGSEPHNMRCIIIKKINPRKDIKLEETAHEPHHGTEITKHVAAYSILCNYVRNLAFHVLDLHVMTINLDMKPIFYYKRLPDYVGYSKGVLLQDPTYDMPKDLLKMYMDQYEIEFVNRTKIPEKQSEVKPPPQNRGKNKTRGGGRGAPAGRGVDPLTAKFLTIKSEEEIAKETGVL